MRGFMLYPLALLVVIGIQVGTASVLKEEMKEKLIEELAKQVTTVTKRSKPSSCTARYAALESSTMCVFHDSSRATNRGVSEAEKAVILSEHNKYRTNVSPTATNMEKMYWDDEIAVIAQKYANTCRNGHDTNKNRQVPGYGIWIGQNLATGYNDWAGAIEAWHDEVKLYKYGEDPNDYLDGKWPEIAHYTQVVRDVSARVGCGFAKCDDTENHVCNYAFGNPHEWGKPYLNGTSCSKCPESCSNNLCDCKGKICLNGGELNPDTCTCTCKGLFAGDMCEKVECPDSDKSYCGKPQPKGFPKHFCSLSSYVRTKCPYMCKVCPANATLAEDSENDNGNNDGNDNENSSNGNDGNDDDNNTENTNNDSSLSKNETDCPLFDHTCCRNWKPSYCTKYSNVPGKCPIMCGRCKEKCPGKNRYYCKKGGTLDADTCECICPKKWMGSTCEELKPEYCPDVDGGRCGTRYPPTYCEKYSDVPMMCPIMCGLCEEKCPGKDVNYCKNKGTLDGDTCTCQCTSKWKGNQCEKLRNCPAQDEDVCKRLKASDCKKFRDIPERCPYLCDLC